MGYYFKSYKVWNIGIDNISGDYWMILFICKGLIYLY